jgi:hypothetical protein
MNITTVATSLNLTNFISVPDTQTETLEKLPSWYIGIAVDIGSDDLFTGTRYRQISVVKYTSSDVKIISAKHFVVTSGLSTVPAVGSIITQTGNANARGVVVKVDTVNSKIYFTQTTITDGSITAFTASGTVVINSNNYGYSSIGQALTGFGTHALSSNVPNGDIVFLENRSAITHEASQVEEVRVVIQF